MSASLSRKKTFRVWAKKCWTCSSRSGLRFRADKYLLSKKIRMLSSPVVRHISPRLVSQTQCASYFSFKYLFIF